MKLVSILTIFLFFIMSQQGFSKINTNTPSIHSETIASIGGKDMALSQFKGKPLLLVNIATQCGYTPQLKGLEALHKQYKDRGLVVLGIPSNDFGGQTPQKEAGVKKFCKLNYGVTFQLTSKTVVKGPKKHPLIANLVGQSSDHKEIGWNFEKFIVDKNGQLVQRFESSVTPENKKLKDAISAVL